MKEPYLDAFGRAMTVGTRVRYVPGHAYGDLNHPDCELGTVTNWNHMAVFVKYDGDLNPKATTPDDLTVQATASSVVMPPEGKEPAK